MFHPKLLEPGWAHNNNNLISYSCGIIYKYFIYKNIHLAHHRSILNEKNPGTSINSLPRGFMGLG